SSPNVRPRTVTRLSRRPWASHCIDSRVSPGKLRAGQRSTSTPRSASRRSPSSATGSLSSANNRIIVGTPAQWGGRRCRACLGGNLEVVRVNDVALVIRWGLATPSVSREVSADHLDQICLWQGGHSHEHRQPRARMLLLHSLVPFWAVARRARR